MRFLVVAALAVAGLGMPPCAIAAPTSVYVSCAGDDTVGSRLCSAVKEKIRQSTAFRLVSDPVSGGFSIRLLSTDDDSPAEGNVSAVAETTTAIVPTTIADMDADAEVYLKSGVFLVGAKAVDDMAESIVAHLDQSAQAFESGLRRQPVNAEAL